MATPQQLGEPGSAPQGVPGELSSLIASVRRLTIGVWCLVALFVVSFAAPWAMYLFTSRPQFGVASPGAVQANPTYVAPQSEFDNDFDVYPPKEQIKKATVILVTALNHDPRNAKEVIGEIVKHAPNVRFYYKVGDSSPAPSHTSSDNCGSCEGSVVLFQGNPATMAVSYSYSHGQVDGLDGMSLAELRQLARASPEIP